jgi:release factor glutamine methyltransferase
VLPGVFHPGFFSSTSFLLEFIAGQPLKNSSLLELGCGTGLISIVASKQGALVFACDLSKTAVENATKNFKDNHVNVDLIHSDLFDAIPKKAFDWIVINPPYYARTIHSDEELAWHCGENFQYFQKLFLALNEYMHQNSQVIMVLTQGCNLERIFEIAQSHNFKFEPVKEKDVLFDGKDFLYRITPINSFV